MSGSGRAVVSSLSGDVWLVSGIQGSFDDESFDNEVMASRNFHAFKPSAHRVPIPEDPVDPIVWVPHSVDNSPGDPIDDIVPIRFFPCDGVRPTGTVYGNYYCIADRVTHYFMFCPQRTDHRRNIP